jgi:MFS family permease
VQDGIGQRSWMARGLMATAVSYTWVALAATSVQIVAAVVAFQLAVNALLAPMMAIMSDEIPDAQKGRRGWPAVARQPGRLGRFGLAGRPGNAARGDAVRADLRRGRGLPVAAAGQPAPPRGPLARR